MKLVIKSLLTLSLSLFVISGIAFGQTQDQSGQAPQGPPGPGGRFGGRGIGPDGPRFGGILPGLNRLNLSDDQKTQIKNLVTAQRASDRSIRQQIRAKAQAFHAAETAANFDQAAVTAAAQDLANAQVAEMVAHATLMHNVFLILTPDQQNQLKTMEQNRQQRFQK